MFVLFTKKCVTDQMKSGCFFVLNNRCPGHHLTIQPDQSHHPREEESCANAYCSRLMSDHRNIERIGHSCDNHNIQERAVALDGQTVFHANKVLMLVHVQNQMTLHLVSQIANPYIEEDGTSKCLTCLLKMLSIP